MSAYRCKEQHPGHVLALMRNILAQRRGIEWRKVGCGGGGEQVRIFGRQTVLQHLSVIFHALWWNACPLGLLLQLRFRELEGFLFGGGFGW